MAELLKLKIEYFVKVTINVVTSKKLILLTLTPITDRTGLADVSLVIKYEKLLGKLLDLIKKSNNMDIIVKLHPGENWHNSSLLKFFKKNYDDIPVYQIGSPKELIQSSDLVININNVNTVTNAIK